jgi:GTP-binding protein LepA
MQCHVLWKRRKLIKQYHSFINKAREIVEKLRNIISRQLFEVNIQASVQNKIIASEKLNPFRKNVIAKCYGGDFSRKRKLLDKQKEGKKKMKMIGTVEVPTEAFVELFSNNNNKS